MTTTSLTPDGSALVLADGHRVPMLGLGVWQVPNGQECVSAVRWALELGYRHIDTAQAYGNEESVGQALRDSGLRRDEVFLTTKFLPGRRDPAVEAQSTASATAAPVLPPWAVSPRTPEMSSAAAGSARTVFRSRAVP